MRRHLLLGPLALRPQRPVCKIQALNAVTFSIKGGGGRSLHSVSPETRSGQGLGGNWSGRGFCPGRGCRVIVIPAPVGGASTFYNEHLAFYENKIK